MFILGKLEYTYRQLNSIVVGWKDMGMEIRTSGEGVSSGSSGDRDRLGEGLPEPLVGRLSCLNATTSTVTSYLLRLASQSVTGLEQTIPSCFRARKLGNDKLKV